MLRTVSIISLVSLLLAGCASGSATWRPFPPERPGYAAPNAAWFVMNGPYADDCWMYGWGCAPPGKVPGITIRGPNPNPAGHTWVVYRDRPVYIPTAKPAPARRPIQHHYATHRRIIECAAATKPICPEPTAVPSKPQVSPSKPQAPVTPQAKGPLPAPAPAIPDPGAALAP